MTHDNEAVIDYVLQLWRDWMSNNFAEIRELWYPARTPGLSNGGVVTEEAWEDLETECEQRIVQTVQGAIAGMTPSMRGAIEHSLGLSSVLRIRDYEGQLEEARQRVYRAVLSQGVC